MMLQEHADQNRPFVDFLVNQERPFAIREGHTVSLGHEMVYVGPPGPIPNMISPALVDRIGFDVFRSPLDVAWLLEVRLDGLEVQGAVGASVQGGWVAKYASHEEDGKLSYYFRTEDEALRAGRMVLTTAGNRIVELVFGRVDIEMSALHAMWVNQVRENFGC